MQKFAFLGYSTPPFDLLSSVMEFLSVQYDDSSSLRKKAVFQSACGQLKHENLLKKLPIEELIQSIAEGVFIEFFYGSEWICTGKLPSCYRSILWNGQVLTSVAMREEIIKKIKKACKEVFSNQQNLGHCIKGVFVPIDEIVEGLLLSDDGTRLIKPPELELFLQITQEALQGRIYRKLSTSKSDYVEVQLPISTFVQRQIFSTKSYLQAVSI